MVIYVISSHHLHLNSKNRQFQLKVYIMTVLFKIFRILSTSHNILLFHSIATDHSKQLFFETVEFVVVVVVVAVEG